MAPEIFSFLGAPTGIWPLESRALGKWAQKSGPCRQGGSYRKGPLNRQGALTDKDLILIRGPYPYRQLRII